MKIIAVLKTTLVAILFTATAYVIGSLFASEFDFGTKLGVGTIGCMFMFLIGIVIKGIYLSFLPEEDDINNSINKVIEYLREDEEESYEQYAFEQNIDDQTNDPSEMDEHHIFTHIRRLEEHLKEEES